MQFLKARRAQLYIFKEMLPSFLLGVIVFLLILLLFQALRLTEFVLVHGVKLDTILALITYMMVSFLPVILPMSLLFSILLTYNRLSHDAELTALRASGLSMAYLTFPAILLGLIISFISLETSFYIGPWGNSKFELITSKIGRSKAVATIREGTFSTGFYDMMVYANKVDSKKGLLEKIFIYDERPNTPMTIIAKRGQLLQNPKNPKQSGMLRLIDGNIHQQMQDSYTKIDFEIYDISLTEEEAQANKNLSLSSYSINHIRSEKKRLKDLDRSQLDEAQAKAIHKKAILLDAEIYKRWSVPFLNIVFSILGVGLGVVNNKRSGKSNGFVTSMGVIVCYWVFYITGENAVKDLTVPAIVGVWYTNAIFLFFGLYRLRKVWN